MTTQELIARGGATTLKPRLIDRLPLGPRCDMEAHHRHSLQGCGRSYSTVPPLRFSHWPPFVWTPSGWKVHPSVPEPAILGMLIDRDGHAATYLELKLGVLVTELFALVDSTSLDTLILEHGSLQCPYITFLTSVRVGWASDYRSCEVVPWDLRSSDSSWFKLLQLPPRCSDSLRTVSTVSSMSRPSGIYLCSISEVANLVV
ncbi:uncharacterized protein LOC109724167 isoform X2 [Ananas comosus]|uniref:Uncharacterized protein LOC109724167 isoform X2 n=1 Tax=Ananas comosus TaxID=4615 RepID=A0A6P5GIL7_ANACO|nr:uncharacterized protein LOC109724167 isoform X2 [Ananas comosus]